MASMTSSHTIHIRDGEPGNRFDLCGVEGLDHADDVLAVPDEGRHLACLGRSWAREVLVGRSIARVADDPLEEAGCL